MKKIFVTTFLFLIVSSTLLLAFSIFTNTDGVYRSYRLNNIPFEYFVNDSTSQEWIAGIDQGAESWNKIKGSYFEFSKGGLTPANSWQQDGISLVYFDANYDNFTPGSGVIAFSGTFTSGDGASFQAVESDLVWNAADFPPATTGAQSQIDLESTMAHEFGHHLGLGHTGDAGNTQPGAGDVISEATMYYAVSFGDTTARSLYVDDIMGAVAIYPRWLVEGTVLDSVSGMPVSDAFFVLNNALNASLESTINFVWPSRPQIGGYVQDTVIADPQTGSYQVIPNKHSFDISYFAFGYDRKDTTITFPDTASIEYLLTYNPRLKLSQTFNLQLQLQDEADQAPIAAEVEIIVKNTGLSDIRFALTVDAGGIESIELPWGSYDLIIIPQLPYAYKRIENFELISDSNFVLNIESAPLLLVDDDYFGGAMEEQNVESYYIDALLATEKELSFAYFDVNAAGEPDLAMLQQFEKLVWFSGGRTTPQLSGSVESNLRSFLDTGGKLLLSGQNLITENQETSLFTDYFKIGFAEDSTAGIFQVYNVPDDPITAEFDDFFIIGEQGADNQVSPDIISVNAGADPIFRYWPRILNKYAGARTEDGTTGYKAVFLAFGLEAVVNSDLPSASTVLRSEIIEKIIDWLDSPITTIENESPTVVYSYSLRQNYPNPFNPTTTITFSVPKSEEVALTVYALSGEKIKTLLSDKLEAGSHQLVWDGKNENGKAVASGVYLYQLKSDGFNRTKKMMLLK